MKNSIIVLFVFMTLNGNSYAQRYLPGQKGIQVTVGTVNGINPQSAFFGGIAVSTYTQNDSRWVFGVELLQKKLDYSQIQIPVAQFTGEAGY
ncbi:MAG: conjugal transfer protein TraO, partial [Paludibacter sp.]